MLDRYRAKASEAAQRPHDGKVAAITIIAIWMVGAAILCWLGFSRWGPRPLQPE
jgi:hypothetical protein